MPYQRLCVCVFVPTTRGHVSRQVPTRDLREGGLVRLGLDPTDGVESIRC